MEKITEIGKSLMSGIVLSKLVATLTKQNEILKLINENPKLILHCMQNATVIQNYIVQQTFNKFDDCSAQDIVQGDTNRICKLLYFLRDRFDLDYLFFKMMNEELQEDELPAPSPIEVLPSIPPSTPPLDASVPERSRKKKKSKSKSSDGKKRSKSQERDKKSKVESSDKALAQSVSTSSQRKRTSYHPRTNKAPLGLEHENATSKDPESFLVSPRRSKKKSTEGTSEEKHKKRKHKSVANAEATSTSGEESSPDVEKARKKKKTRSSRSSVSGSRREKKDRSGTISSTSLPEISSPPLEISQSIPSENHSQPLTINTNNLVAGGGDTKRSTARSVADNSVIQTARLQRAQLAVRKKIFDELVETERSYVFSLSCVCNILMKKLHSVASTEEIKSIFSNIEDILKNHHGLLQALSKVSDSYDNATTVADVFLSKVLFFLLSFCFPFSLPPPSYSSPLPPLLLSYSPPSPLSLSFPSAFPPLSRSFPFLPPFPLSHLYVCLAKIYFVHLGGIFEHLRGIFEKLFHLFGFPLFFQDKKCRIQ